MSKTGILVLDKNALQACVHNLAPLVRICRHFCLLMTDPLIYELCADIRGRRATQSYFNALGLLPVSVSYRLLHLLHTEERTKRPTKSVIDTEATWRFNANFGRPIDEWFVGYPPKEERQFIEHGLPQHFKEVIRIVREDRSFGDPKQFARAAKDQGRASLDLVVTHLRQGGFIKSLLGGDTTPEAPPDQWVTSYYWGAIAEFVITHWESHTELDKWCVQRIANAHLDLFYIPYLLHADGIVTNEKGTFRRIIRSLFPKTLIYRTDDEEQHTAGQARRGT